MRILKSIFSIIIIVVLCFAGYIVYDKIDSSELEIADSILFNRYGFSRGENKLHVSKFTKDDQVKYSSKKSLCIENPEFNDASFIKTIQVKPNTPYKVTCMVKTEKVEREDGDKIAGANIAIIDSTEKSKSLIGDNDWIELTFMFNSRNRTEVSIALRLGAYDSYAKGKCWFSNFKIEEGIKLKENTNWNVLCLIYKQIDVDININGKIKNIKLSMSDDDISTIKEEMNRFKQSCNELSNNKMSVSYDIKVIDSPITTLTYSENNEYYVAPEDVEQDLEKIISDKEYDHIFVVTRLTDKESNLYVPVNDWLGLGSMDYLGIGYSLVRMPDKRTNYIYKYSSNVQFPEEVFVHEFLHTLERNQSDLGYDVPDLHGNEMYGYVSDLKEGLKIWYKDYMNKEIQDIANNSYVGIEKNMYSYKPVHKNDFINSIVIDYCI